MVQVGADHSILSLQTWFANGLEPHILEMFYYAYLGTKQVQVRLGKRLL
jgi:hypothetical protein